MRTVTLSESVFMAFLTFALGFVMTTVFFDNFIIPNYTYNQELVNNYGYAPEENRSSDFERAVRIKFDLLNDDYDFITWEAFVDDSGFVEDLIQVWVIGVPLERQPYEVHELFNYRTLPE